jgi:XTP/dITP diphosphohydrolase
MKGISKKDRLVIATHNKGKLAEFSNLLQTYFDNIISAGSLNLPEPEETGATFAENAILKAESAARLAGCAALADDSGVCITALNGDPGLFSARWAGPQKNFQYAMQQVHDKLDKATDRSAHFICVLALVLPSGEKALFEGRIDGAITWPPRGTYGHGYDPVFVPEGDTRTFAEITDDEKNCISHRALAVRKLIAYLQDAQ